MEIPIYKRYFFFKKECELSNQKFKGWGYRYLDGPYCQSPNGTFGRWKYVSGEMSDDKEGVYQLIKIKRAMERKSIREKMENRYPQPPKPRTINERKYHPIKK